SPKEDPRGSATGKMRVLRGGAWDSTPDKCRAAYRNKEFPVYSDACFGADSYGFRRARNQRPSPTVSVAKGEGKELAKKTPADDKKPVVAPPSTGKIELATLKGTIV